MKWRYSAFFRSDLLEPLASAADDLLSRIVQADDPGPYALLHRPETAGPGDPAETDHPKIAHLRGAVDTLLAERRPFLAVCLSHQVLSCRLGFPLRRRDVPNQGTQKEIDLFGARERVGFYNTFAAVAHDDKADVDGVGAVEVSRDTDTGEVHALRGPHFASMQFHAESVLTQEGPRIVATAIRDVVAVFFEADDLPADRMQAVARETNLSETTFVLTPQDGGDARIRIFTPVNELPFAGHPPTVARSPPGCVSPCPPGSPSSTPTNSSTRLA
ncbi:hypothetical protein EEJ42_19845 [Streptomyces botrytidirepellens]|uniref:Glutamine amidotransferase domain-containing protein n=1 Tax=Streptomyces botrytidirepellens TaxID=2486417 RepID=A0A3M8VZN3_9ACTN|nr:hypothetical protein EEJ42_19845 [Streptomyces botrytidirepellens]